MSEIPIPDLKKMPTKTLINIYNKLIEIITKDVDSIKTTEFPGGNISPYNSIVRKFYNYAVFTNKNPTQIPIKNDKLTPIPLLIFLNIIQKDLCNENKDRGHEFKPTIKTFIDNNQNDSEVKTFKEMLEPKNLEKTILNVKNKLNLKDQDVYVSYKNFEKSIRNLPKILEDDEPEEKHIHSKSPPRPPRPQIQSPPQLPPRPKVKPQIVVEPQPPIKKTRPSLSERFSRWFRSLFTSKRSGKSGMFGMSRKPKSPQTSHKKVYKKESQKRSQNSHKRVTKKESQKRCQKRCKN